LRNFALEKEVKIVQLSGDIEINIFIQEDFE